MSVRRVENPGPPVCCNCLTDPTGRRLLTLGETARLCNVSVKTVYAWMESGRVEWVYNAGGKRLVYRDTLLISRGKVRPKRTLPRRRILHRVSER